MTRKNDLIVGLITPDEIRKVPTEVFVGQLLPVPDPIFVEGLQDSILLTQVWGLQGWYRGRIQYYQDATVTISSEDQTVRLTHVGFGTYRDVNNVLHVEPGKVYRLKVERPRNKVYIARVRVPGPFHITTMAEGETLGVTVGKIQDIDTALVRIKWTKSNGSFLYRMESRSDNFTFTVFHYAIYPLDRYTGIAIIYNHDPPEEFRDFELEVFAFDTAYSKIYQPVGTWSASPRAQKFLDEQTNLSIESRSSIQSNTHAVGAFGAYYRTIRRFVARAVRDSTQTSKKR